MYKGWLKPRLSIACKLYFSFIYCSEGQSIYKCFNWFEFLNIEWSVQYNNQLNQGRPKTTNGADSKIYKDENHKQENLKRSQKKISATTLNSIKEVKNGLLQISWTYALA